MVSDLFLARIVQLRGLGFEYQEIADFLNVDKGKIVYWAGKIEKQARKEGVDEVYAKIMVDAILPKIISYAKILEDTGF